MEEIKDPWPNVEFVKNMSTLNVTSVTFKQQKRKKTYQNLKRNKNQIRTFQRRNTLELEKDLVFLDPLLFLYADYKIKQDEEMREHHPTLVCWQ